MKTKTIVMLLTIGALAIWALIFLLTAKQLTPKDYVRIYGPSLVAIHREWVKDGKPFPPQLDNYTQGMSNAKDITVRKSFVYLIYGKPFRPLFQMNFGSKGSLLVNQEGKIAWWPYQKEKTVNYGPGTTWTYPIR